ncbi:helix-turn-helix domain-containing protein [Jidongwangia harbinensis]|uniref:helix-turn-helix domain-containing protein n=1 Tax=Jidongwangia harbinensis TaxID=2878561 RepID=UPI001CD984E3|nr:helix-turn-helix transcriptional regulator [Jidongwangia harbinensis]MCA2214757.1 helix-turn-helix domain-containing protein [Jidongwangia harbinensis]
MTEHPPSTSPGPAEPSVGTVLARMRRRAKLTGHQLAQRVDMSQTKISRIENDVGHTTPEDVKVLAEALGASSDVVADLVERAERAHDRMTDWRATPGAVADIQQEVEQLEKATRVFRVFQPAVVPGLAQTSEYARAVLGVTHRVRTGVNPEDSVAAVPQAVSVRLRRQIALADQTKEFHFVITEAVLSNRFGRPDNMPPQIERLRELAGQANVTLAVIPATAALEIPPYHGFELFDDRMVGVDTVNTLLRTRGSSDVELYRLVFDALARSATTDIDPILDHYYHLYLELSLSRRGRPGGQA